MTFLQPYLLWAMLAVVMPVAIHFWYQRRGKTIEWAAMRWLGEQTTLQHRGFRPNEIGLMLLRCLLVALLALIVSRPIVAWFENITRSETIHLVQPDRLVTDSYRFELENALRDGEQVYWLGVSPEKVASLEKMPTLSPGLTYLQNNINALATANAPAFKLYFRNNLSLASSPRIYIPGDYQLFSVTDSSNKAINLLQNKPAYKDIIHVLLDYRDADERKAVTAALSALTEVYGFAFEIEKKSRPGRHYDWVFTNNAIEHPEPGTRYIVSGAMPEWAAPASVISLPDSLRLADSELVESGRLPEWLGDLLVNDLKLNAGNEPLSDSQLNALFIKAPAAQQEATLRPWLLLVFICLMIAERWLALRKTVTSHG
ncbi:BatA domain-containing protein [Dyadobacter sp. CY261]|uniref:BatA domain-containing protein n=1 Tax=Dyadobacter sp. CY261 TaxID=2907203 RepID=UPI001F227377|nr:BatA domain-containing protein [Dyadobacter sp. CY261]MCF0073911.1 BatA domain-containing protein [Dyadobacter sp. CY261]